jgi:2-dehydro-3-deoxygluconokinase
MDIRLPEVCEKKVATFGEALVNLCPVRRGRLKEYSSLEIRVAGAECNVAIGLSRLGFRVSYIGAVGKDTFGNIVQKRLNAEGVDVSHIKHLDLPTGVFIKEWYGFGDDPAVWYYRKGSAGSNFTPDNLDFELLKQVSIFHTTGINLVLGDTIRSSARQLILGASESGVKISFDVNIRLKLASPDVWTNEVSYALQFADYILLTEDELRILYGLEDPCKLYRTAKLKPEAIVIMKKGAKGASAYNYRSMLESVSGIKVDTVVDPVGAGDGFAAGFIAGILWELELRHALEIGNLVGALSVTELGDFEAYPHKSELNSFLHQNLLKR